MGASLPAHPTGVPAELGVAQTSRPRHAEYAEAEEPLREGLELTRRLGEPFGVATALCSLGRAASAQGRMDQAGECYDEALQVARHAGAGAVVPFALHGLAELAHARGDLSNADALFQEAIIMARRERRSPAAMLGGLARVEAARGATERAANLFEESADLARRGGQAHVLATVLHDWGVLVRKQGKTQQAGALQVESLRVGHQIRNWVRVMLSLEGLAALAADTRRFEVAARLFAAADRLAQEHSHRGPSRYDAEREAAGHALGPERFERATQEGAGLSLADAVSYASRHPVPRDPSATGWSALSEVERQVIALVAEHMTNVEIGERLFISPRTASTHLSRIYAKLGISSRRELARQAREPHGPKNTVAST